MNSHRFCTCMEFLIASAPQGDLGFAKELREGSNNQTRALNKGNTS